MLQEGGSAQVLAVRHEEGDGVRHQLHAQVRRRLPAIPHRRPEQLEFYER